MRLSYVLLATAFAACAQTPETPLQSLPYSPSLDLTDMDRTANPCADFYRYSCGGWLKKNPIPSDQASWSVYGKLYEDNQRFLWGILEDASKPNPARSAVERKIGDFFAACMDEPAVEKAGSAPLRAELDAIGALKSAADFPELLAREHLALDYGMLFAFSSNQDFADSSREIPEASAGGLGLPDRDYYTKTDRSPGRSARNMSLTCGGCCNCWETPRRNPREKRRLFYGSKPPWRRLRSPWLKSATPIISFTRWISPSSRL